MTIFACVKWGNKYGPEYVNILFDMVRRNLPSDYEGAFLCFTDDPTGIDARIETRPITEDLEGWWNKLYLFKEGVFQEGERIVYMDLDTVITGPLDDIFNYTGEFAILRDFMRHEGMQSSVMLWRAGFGKEIWDSYVLGGKPSIVGGDQAWIEQAIIGPDYLQDLFPGLFCSYKLEAAHMFPKGASVVVFHGEPRPHEALGWVPYVWRVGGGSGNELSLPCNTPDQELYNNISACIKRPLEWLRPETMLDKHVAIVGGAPSIDGLIEEIKWRQSQGHEIWALNKTALYLNGKGITPDAMIVIDAREKNIEFVRDAKAKNYYFASQVHPVLFDAVPQAKVFHLAIDGMVELIQDDPRVTCATGVGKTVGTNAMALAYMLGFQNVHLYGYDSCLKEDQHHAYYQDLTDKEKATIEVECGGRKFLSTPWMLDQVDAFQSALPLLLKEGMVITTHGDGLLQHAAAKMSATVKEHGDLVEIDEIFWPKQDRVCRPFTLACMEDISKVIEVSNGRKVAIQAGGNVGLWPREFAKYFEQVYTFEPDHVNFRCLALNCTAPNVVKMQAALGSKHESISLARDLENCGAYFVRGGGSIPVLCIDDLMLDACDLIQLDIEGFELNALEGAVNTIKQHHPVIVVEDKGLSEKFGTKQGAIGRWLEQFGYSEHSRIHRDIIYTTNVNSN